MAFCKMVRICFSREYLSLKQSNLNQVISFIISDKIVIGSFESRISHLKNALFTVRLVGWLDECSAGR